MKVIVKENLLLSPLRLRNTITIDQQRYQEKKQRTDAKDEAHKMMSDNFTVINRDRVKYFYYNHNQ